MTSLVSALPSPSALSRRRSLITRTQKTTPHSILPISRPVFSVQTNLFLIFSRSSSALRSLQIAAARKSKTSRAGSHPSPRTGRVGGTIWRNGRNGLRSWRKE